MAGSRIARASTKRTAVRRRAVGTRERIIAHLAAIAEISDPAGMASTRLAEAVGYPGSSVAFAQLLSGMERDGLIAREVRGKRTYRIMLSGDAIPAPPAPESAPVYADGAEGTGDNPATESMRAADAATAAAESAGAGFDYDELARRLLIQVVRRLAATPTDLEQTVAGLERELITAWTRHGTLTAENVRLREQLRETQRHLELLRQRSPRLEITDELDKTEVVVLERLLAPDADGEGATASQRA
jgi:hypothetical protein